MLKRGTVIRGIHLTDNADEIEGAYRQGQGPGAAHGVFEEGVRENRRRAVGDLPVGRFLDRAVESYF